jgi:hypothetical protein
VHVARFFGIRAKTAAIYAETFAGRHARIPSEIQNLIREAARRQGAPEYSSNLELSTHLELLLSLFQHESKKEGRVKIFLFFWPFFIFHIFLKIVYAYGTNDEAGR